MYGKIYEQTFTGSMAGTGADVFALWAYIIAHTKPDSMVEINPLIVGAQIGAEVESIEKAINFLLEPDERSRSKTFEGRRLIKKGEFIYFVPQASKYRGLPNNESRRQYWAEKQREHRQRVKDCQPDSSKMSRNVIQAEAVHSTHNTNKDIGANDSHPMSDLDLVAKFSIDPTYAGIDVKREFGKMIAWCEVNSKTPTRRRFVNWLNRAERPINKPKEMAPNYPELPERREISDEELAHHREIARAEIAKLTDKFKMQ
jgi:hypothetical protein